MILDKYSSQFLSKGNVFLMDLAISIVVSIAVAVLAFLLFEPRSLLSYRCTFFTFVPMGIYGIFYLIRAYTHVGPDGTISLFYDIYGLARWGLWATIGIFFAFMAVSFLLCLLLFFQNSRKKPD